MSKQSNIQVQIGQDFEGDGKSSASLKVTMNSQKTQEKLNAIQQETGHRFDSLNFSVVITIENGDNDKLLELVNILWSEDPGEEIIDQMFFYKFKKAFASQSKPETQVSNGKFFLKLSLKEELLESIQGNIQGLLAMGLSDAAQAQENTISMNLLVNKSPEEFVDSIKSGNRSLVPLLSQSKFQFKVDLEEGLFEPLSEVLSGINEKIDDMPQMMFFNSFKNFDLKISMDSFEELPEFIRKELIPLKKSSEDSESRQLDLENKNQSLLISIINAMGSSFQLDLFIEEFAHLNLSISAPGLSALLVNYFGFILARF